MPAIAYVGVGSNLGNRHKVIQKAQELISAHPAVRFLRSAPIYETHPVGGPPQGPYLNTVVEAETTLQPRDLLNALQAIEQRLGRIVSAERWAPRPIDLDILLYDELVMAEPGLAIPHPRMHERAFVLEPLAQLAPDAVHPLLKHTIVALRERLNASSST